MASTLPPAAPRPADATSGRYEPLLYILLGIVLGVIGTVGTTYGAKAWKAYNEPAAVFLRHNRSADSSIVQTASGLQYKVLKPGAGAAKPTDADVVLVNYEGKLENGTTFDASPQPTPMPVKGVVPGFSEALKLMPKGAKYRVWIPPVLGYGDKVTGPIPANSVLVFDLEMLDWKSEAEIRQMQMLQQMQAQGAGAAPPPGAVKKP
ncbi:FKBP-type peptidyl-prolyl cis-trans isomerase [Sphingomonas sp. AR_OL41]|uniref:FKBP-type peptidyl-prolyl cis-trans isomerase n=1 Tax=Sphingomonas sp. AR_OL41 TaxID=3042729 RepID=UPI0024813641|nr:FKBP-type peptidyl-prolyl cis-trans isomerase [Sphingomonas sp. AR_OL41]MDH7974511.1 FKBP-type peptidyl-prolyl cis-trans isomerase [Sphingomonas sp. AR_OL41]